MPVGMPPGPKPPGAPEGLFFSTMTAWVVSMMPAMEHELSRPFLVTCAAGVNNRTACNRQREALHAGKHDKVMNTVLIMRWKSAALLQKAHKADSGPSVKH